jgi:hypothetical protein
VAALGATALAAAVLAHGVALVRQLRRALPSRFGATVRYYVAAAGLLPVGTALGTALARGLGDPVHEQVILAHVSLNVLGWVALPQLAQGGVRGPGGLALAPPAALLGHLLDRAGGLRGVEAQVAQQRLDVRAALLSTHGESCPH